MFLILPYRVGRRLQHIPFVTIALIVTNVVASFVFFGFMSGAVNAAAIAAHSQAEFDVMIVRSLGAWAFYPDWRGLYTWFTSSFLHGNILHLVTNMFFLWLFGSVVEDAIGRWRFLALYVGGAAAAAGLYAVTSLVTPGGPQLALGASGALAAVMALFAIRFYRVKMRFFYLIFIKPGRFETTSVVGVALWGALELVYGLMQVGGLSSSTAHWAHLGGLAFGIVAAYTLGFLKDASAEYLLDESMSHAAAGAHAVAADKYGQLAESDPNNPFWVLAQARETLLSSMGDHEKAGVMYAQATEKLLQMRRLPEALDAYDNIGTSPVALSPRALLAVGSAAESTGRPDLAERAYREVIDGHPDAQEVEKAYFRLAHVCLTLGRSDDAAGWWHTFEQRYPASEWTAFADPALTRVAG